MAYDKPTVHDRWYWPRLVKALWEAGFIVVKRPDLLERANQKKPNRPWA